MNIIPNYAEMQKLAHKYILKYWDGTLPIDSIKLAHNVAQSNKNLKIYTYTELSKELNVSVERIKKVSDDGYLSYNEKKDVFYLVYNNEIEDKRKIQWTVAHELGHYSSENIFKTPGIYKFSDGHTKEIKEIEADYFAKNLMIPLPILCSINEGENPILSPYDIMEISNLNFSPSLYVYNHLYNKLTPYIINKLPYKKELEILFNNELKILKRNFDFFD